ncbi:hypothetical protein FOL46_000575, partial [Perkinsus olseni]
MSVAENEVLTTTEGVVDTAKDVTINSDAVEAFANTLRQDAMILPLPWEECECHLVVDVTTDAGAELTALFVLLLDSMNFCFWPASNFEYEQLSNGVKVPLSDIYVDTAPFVLWTDTTQGRPTTWRTMDSLAEASADDICGWFNNGARTVDDKDKWRPRDFPLIEDRVRLVHELACCLRDNFNGSALKLAESADGSALRLMRILSALLPGFRDQAIDSSTGRQVFFYKRAQICVADIWGAFRRRGKPIRAKLDFADMSSLTMFPDYRVPQLLRHKGILVYSPALCEIVDSREPIAAGSRTELEIRACTIHACHRIAEATKRSDIFDVTLDWLLWQEGEAIKDDIKPHHLFLNTYELIKATSHLNGIGLRVPVVLDYLSEAYGVDRSFLQDPSHNASLAAAQDLGLNLSWQRRVTDSSLAHRAVLHQQASLSVEEMVSLLSKIYHSYFEEARDIGDAQVSQDILPSTLSTAGAVPWRTAVEGVPLIEFRQQGATVAQLSGEDVESDRIYDTINRIVC